MKIKRGRVVSDISPNEDGSFWVEMDGTDDAVRVAYSSPSYNTNHGGIFAPPSIDSHVILFEDENPKDNNPSFYYVATIVDDPPQDPEKKIPEFKAVRPTAPGDQIYGSDKRPKGMTLANSDGQGFMLKSDITNFDRENYASLEGESGGYISVGEKGCQIVNEHKDGIVVQGEPNGISSGRSISIGTAGMIQQVAGTSLNLLVGKEGDDINIGNLSNPLGGAGLSAGNVRIHSQNRDITLKTGPKPPPGVVNPVDDALATRNINIITPGAEIQVNGQTGAIVIRSVAETGGITLDSSTFINLNAPTIGIAGALSMTGGAMTLDPLTGSMKINVPRLEINGGTTTIGGSVVDIQGIKASITSNDPKILNAPFGNGSAGLTTVAAVFPGVAKPPVVVPDPPVPIPGVVVPNTYGDSPLT